MNFMVYLNNKLQLETDYSIDESGNLTAINWSQGCQANDIITIIFVTPTGAHVRRTNNVCDSIINVGEAPTYLSSIDF